MTSTQIKALRSVPAPRLVLNKVLPPLRKFETPVVAGRKSCKDCPRHGQCKFASIFEKIGAAPF